MSLKEDQVLKATTSLLNHLKNKKSKERARAQEAQSTNSSQDPKRNLFDEIDADSENHLGEQNVYLNIITKLVPNKTRNKPLRLPVAHSLYFNSSDGTTGSLEACLFVKDGDEERVKSGISEHSKELGFVKQVMSVSELRNKYKPYESKRLLLGSYDLFMVDDRVYPFMKKLLGTKFYTKKKQPVIVNIAKYVTKKTPKTNVKTSSEKVEEASPNSSEALVKELTKAVFKSTYLASIPQGNTISIKIGATNIHDAQKLQENAVIVANYVVDNLITKKWKNIHSINIKSDTSIALPVYLAPPTKTATIVNGADSTSTTKNEQKKQSKPKAAPKTAPKTAPKSKTPNSETDSAASTKAPNKKRKVAAK